MGNTDGNALGTDDGSSLELLLGEHVGFNDGAVLGTVLGIDDGLHVGDTLGRTRGADEGMELGITDGASDGSTLGLDDGLTLGLLLTPIHLLNSTPNRGTSIWCNACSNAYSSISSTTNSPTRWKPNSNAQSAA